MDAMNPGNQELGPVAPEVIETLRKISVQTISGQLAKRGLRRMFMTNVRPIRNDLTIVGPAFTLRYIPAREDITIPQYTSDPKTPQRRTVEIAPPGSVVVMDCRREVWAAGLGGILSRRMQRRGVEGVVLDGGLRDFEEVEASGFPVFCCGPAAPPNNVLHHPVDFDVPIACGAVPVFPGDIICGNREGVVVIPRYLAEEIARDALEQEDREVFLLEKVDKGASIVGVYPPSEETLAEYETWKQNR